MFQIFASSYVIGNGFVTLSIQIFITIISDVINIIIITIIIIIVKYMLPSTYIKGGKS